MYDRRINLLSVVFYLYKTLKNYFFGFIFLLIWKPILGLIALMALVTISFVKYFTYRYSILDEQILIKHGIFFKKELHIPYDKIQSIQHNQWFFLKPLNLEQLVVNTASHSDSKSRIDLQVVSIKVGKFLETKHLIATGENSKEITNDNQLHEPFYQASSRDVNIFAATNFSLVSTIILIFVLITRFFNDSKRLFNDVNQSLSMYFVILLFIAFILILYVIDFLRTKFKYHNFTLDLNNDNFRISLGLFKRKTDKIPINKIQNVIFSQNIIRRLLGLTTVKVDLINEKSDNDFKNSVLIPFIDSSLVKSKVGRLFSYTNKNAYNIFKSYKYAFWLFLRNTLFLPIIICILIILFRSYFLDNIFWLLISLVTIFSLLMVINVSIKAKNIEVGLINAPHIKGVITIKDVRFFNYYTNFIVWDKIQSMEIRQTYFMKKYANIAHLVINIRMGENNKEIQCRYLKYDDAQKIMDWYKLT
ncbi:PH domain-containing protein [Apilactobacillus xinyiensis]|uniref:PH domain-containing protein n=1 Tax=Apilactobacillus xinyiensis TaxID=2841032 RepID=UPI00201084A2|nr:PH domain-containing protein [Apilactobacillus xinyiensis]MCL0330438.1 PH domain-containing protein [Apilactobacillus xinyiensis]